MKNLLSKTLLCGALASAFLLVNCQKAPNREVKPKVDLTGKPQAVVGVCTADVLKKAKELEEKKAAINVELSKTGDLSDDAKNALTKLANDLKLLTDELMAEIEKIKVADKKAENCKVHEDNDPAKKATGKEFLKVQIKNGALDLGKKVKTRTGQPNDIVKGILEALAPQQVLKIDNADLAAALSKKDSSNGAVAIIEANVVKGDAAKSALADTSKVACSLTLGNDSAIIEGSEVEVTTLSDVKEVEQADKTKRKVIEVSLTVKGSNELIGLTCNIPDALVAGAKLAVREALGNLVSNKSADVEPVVPVDNTAPAAPGDKAPVPTPAPTTTAANLANEAIKALDTAEARK
ncbi:MAG: hypothetical protein AABY53_09465 [Bdellovibrionota bacterium]